MLSNAIYIQGHTFFCEAAQIFGGIKKKHREKLRPWEKKLPRKKMLQVAQPRITRGPAQWTLNFPHTNTCFTFQQVLLCAIPTFHKLHFAYFKGDDKEKKIIF